MNEVLTVGRVEIANTVTERLQALCDQYEMGIKVDQVVLQDVNPPDPVKPPPPSTRSTRPSRNGRS